MISQNQRTEISLLEEENKKYYKEKEQLKGELEDKTKKLEFSNENYKELQIMVLTALNRKESNQENPKNCENEESLNNENNKNEDQNNESIIKAEMTLKEQEISRLKYEISVSFFFFLLFFFKKDFK